MILHEISSRLINIPDLKTALEEISMLMNKMLGAEDSGVIRPDSINVIRTKGIPLEFIKNIIQENQGIIILDNFRYI